MYTYVYVMKALYGDLLKISTIIFSEFVYMFVHAHAQCFDLHVFSVDFEYFSCFLLFSFSRLTHFPPSLLCVSSMCPTDHLLCVDCEMSLFSS